MTQHRKYARRRQRRDRSLIKFVRILFLLFERLRYPRYTSKYSKKTFSNWQLFALLVIRAKSKLSVEDFVEQFLPSADALTKELGLEILPVASTLRKFARRLKAQWAHHALGGCAVLAGVKDAVTGIDGTGHSKQRGSRHYQRRVGQRTKRRDFLKVVGLDDLTTQLVLALKIRKKARHDNVDFKPTVRRARRQTRIASVIGDKAFDAQKSHDAARSVGAELIAPLRNKNVPVHRTKGADRKRLKRRFPTTKYHRRSKKETVWGVVKQRYDDVVTALVFHMQKVELLCRYLAYNVDRLLTLQKRPRMWRQFTDELRQVLAA